MSEYKKSNKLLLKIFLAIAAMVLILKIIIDFSSPSKPKATVVVAHWLQGYESQLKKIQDKYFAETGKRVNFDFFANGGEYYSRLRDEVSKGNTSFDIHGILSGKLAVANFANYGKIQNLTEVLDTKALLTNAEPQIRNYITFAEGNLYRAKPGIYGVPLDQNSFVVFYNKKIFKKCGLPSTINPNSWSEFITISTQLAKCGQNVFSWNLENDYLTQMFLLNFVLNQIETSKISDTFKGNASYDTAEWKLSFETISEFSKRFQKNLPLSLGAKVQERFIKDQLAMIYDGSWFFNMLQTTSLKDNFGMFLLPPISNSQKPVMIKTLGTTFYVNKVSTAKDEAIQFISWLSKEDNINHWAKTFNSISSMKSGYSVLDTNIKILVDSASRFENAIEISDLEDDYIMEMLINGIEQIFLRKLGPSELIKSLEAARLRKIDK